MCAQNERNRTGDFERGKKLNNIQNQRHASQTDVGFEVSWETHFSFSKQKEITLRESSVFVVVVVCDPRSIRWKKKKKEKKRWKFSDKIRRSKVLDGLVGQTLLLCGRGVKIPRQRRAWFGLSMKFAEVFWKQALQTPEIPFKVFVCFSFRKKKSTSADLVWWAMSEISIIFHQNRFWSNTRTPHSRPNEA